VEANIAVDFEQRRRTRLGEARKAAIILRGELDPLQAQRMARAVTIAFAVHQHAVTIGLAHPGERPFGLQEGVEFLGKGNALEAAVQRLGVVSGLAKRLELFEIIVAEAPERRLVGLAALTGERNQHDLTRKL